jgi:hypothetical protein
VVHASKSSECTPNANPNPDHEKGVATENYRERVTRVLGFRALGLRWPVHTRVRCCFSLWIIPVYTLTVECQVSVSVGVHFLISLNQTNFIIFISLTSLNIFL